MVKTKEYQGKKPEIVLVGFDELCCLGYAEHKHMWQKTGDLPYIDLALRMGILEFQKQADSVRCVQVQTLCKETNTLQALPKNDLIEWDFSTEQVRNQFIETWREYIRANTGLRRLTFDNCGFDPNNFQTLVSTRLENQQLSKSEFELLQRLEIQLEDVQEHSDGYTATIVRVTDQPFCYPLDMGGPLPTGWNWNQIGLPPKEIRKMNSTLLMVYETVYRLLLKSTLHPLQSRLDDFFDVKRISFHAPTGIGPMNEIEAIGLDTFHGLVTRPKALSHCLANTILGYIAPALGIKGKISTHVGACESVMGGLGDAYRDLKSGEHDAALVVGYDWGMTAVGYNGFVANGAFITNEQLVKACEKMIADGLISDPEIIETVNTRLQNDQRIKDEVEQVNRNIKDKTLDRSEGRKQKLDLQRKRIGNFQYLPKKMYELASMPFHKYRNGFVMSIGAGGGFLTTLDNAIQFGLPIRALVAGIGEKIPDGAGDGYGSIAVLGDGVGDAFEKAFLEAKTNYQTVDENGARRELSINDIAAWWAHGTSTPTNGFGERREIHRILEKYGRDPKRPIPLSGDKEAGHRIGGNFPSGACFILQDEKIYPFRNFNVADEELDQQFSLTKIVGKAGLGAGNPIDFDGKYIAVNGAGFGKINSNLILKKFNPEDLDLPQNEIDQYLSKVQVRLDEASKLESDIQKNIAPLYADTADTAKSRGEKSDMSKMMDNSL